MKRFSLFLFLVLNTSAFAGLSPRDFFCAQSGKDKAPSLIYSTGEFCGGKSATTVKHCAYTEVFCIYLQPEKRAEFFKKSPNERKRLIQSSAEKVSSRVACKPQGDKCPSLDECKDSVDVSLGVAKVVEGGVSNHKNAEPVEKNSAGDGK